MNTKKKTLSVLTMAATALLFAACDKDEVGGPFSSRLPGRNPGPTMRHGSKMQTDNGL